MLENLVVHYGYLAVFVGTFLEGETILTVAGFLAAQGYMDLPFVIIFGFIGSLMGDQFFFYLGRRHGGWILKKSPRLHGHVKRVHNLFDKGGFLWLIGFRFVYGLRMITPIVLGTSEMSNRYFFMLNMAGAALWSVVVALLGFFIGNTIQIFFHEAKHYELLIAGIILGVFLIAHATKLIYDYLGVKVGGE
jgi:membrane protein DedA with SNARE-associated domain